MKRYNDIPESLKVTLVDRLENPYLTPVIAMKRCHESMPYLDLHEKYKNKSREYLADLLIKYIVAHGHYSILEFMPLTFAVDGFPHSVMVQITRHRHCGYAVMSQRYVSEQILKLAEATSTSEDIEKHFWFRPIGTKYQHKGASIYYTQEHKDYDRRFVESAIKHFQSNIEKGMPCETARDFLPQGIIQPFMFCGNERTMKHILNLRAKADAQLEIQWLCELMFRELESYIPELCKDYVENWSKRSVLAY